jgi:hypothetical protein
MWMLSLVPNEVLQWFVHGVLALSVIVFIASRFSGIYKLPLGAFAFVLLIFAVYFEGGYGVEMEWRNKVAQVQEKVKEAEEQSEKVNTVIETKFVEKVKVIKETANANIQYVDRVVTKYDNLCTLSNSAIVLHDSASRNEVARSTIGLDEGTTSLKISDVLSTVTDNYSTYYQVREQVLGWQQWYREQKKIFESVK